MLVHQLELENLLSSKNEIDLDCLDALRQQGADIYALDEKGRPLFWKLTHRPHEEKLIHLLDVGKLDGDIKNKQGHSLLELLLQDTDNYIELITCLIRTLPREALSRPILSKDRFNKDRTFHRPLAKALLIGPHYHLIDLIEARGVSLPLPSKKREDFDSVSHYFRYLEGNVEFYLAYKDNPELLRLRGDASETIVFHMLENDSDRISCCNLAYLLKQNPKVLLDKDQNNSTPVHVATERCVRDYMNTVIFPSMIIPALQKLPEFDYSQLNAKGQSPLHNLARASCQRRFFSVSNRLPEFLYRMYACDLKISETPPKTPNPLNTSRTAIFYLDKQREIPQWTCNLTEKETISIIVFNPEDDVSLALNHLSTLKDDKQQHEIMTKYAQTLFQGLSDYIEITSIDVNVFSSSGSTPFYYAVNFQNFDAAYSLLANGANPLLSANPDRDPINMIDRFLVELKDALFQPKWGQKNETIQRNIEKWNALRKAATIGYAERLIMKGDVENSVLACKRVRKNDAGYEQAQYLLAEILLNKAMDEAFSSEQKANLHYLVLPYYINASGKDKALVARRDRFLRKMYQLSETTPAEEMQLFVDQFKRETKAAEMIQRIFRKSQQVSKPVAEKAIHKPKAVFDYLSDLTIVLEKLENLYGDISSLSEKQHNLLIQRLKSIIGDAVIHNDVENEKIALDLLVGLYQEMEYCNPEKAEVLSNQIMVIMDELAEKGSCQASLFAVSVYEKEAENAVYKEKIKDHLLRLVDSHDFEKKIKALETLEHDYQLKIPCEISPQLFGYLSDKIVNDTQGMEPSNEAWVKWAITFFQLDPNGIQHDGFSLMRAAAGYASKDMMHFLVENKGDINHQSGGMTPLEQALQAGNANNVDFLLGLGAKIDVSNVLLLEEAINNGAAVYGTSFEQRFQIFKRLITEGVAVSDTALKNAETLQERFRSCNVPAKIATAYVPLIKDALEKQTNVASLQAASLASVSDAKETFFASKNPNTKPTQDEQQRNRP